MVPGAASSQVAGYAEVPRRIAPRPIVIKSPLRHFLIFIFLLLQVVSLVSAAASCCPHSLRRKPCTKTVMAAESFLVPQTQILRGRGPVVVVSPAQRPKGFSMQAHSPQEITRLLVAWGDGDQSALEELAPLVHSELHRLAHHYMGGERPGHTLQTSALGNDGCIRLVD